MVTYVLLVPSGEESVLLSAGQTISGAALLLKLGLLQPAKLTVNTEKMWLSSMIVKELKQALEKENSGRESKPLLRFHCHTFIKHFNE